MSDLAFAQTLVLRLFSSRLRRLQGILRKHWLTVMARDDGGVSQAPLLWHNL